jgi:hypothetical protein
MKKIFLKELLRQYNYVVLVSYLLSSMRKAFVAFVLITLSQLSYAQVTDSLVIRLRSGVIKKFALLDIKRVLVDSVNSTSVELRRSPDISLRLAPNPASSTCRLYLDNASEAAVTVDVFDALGSLVRSFSAINHGGASPLAWDCRNQWGEGVANGPYRVRVTLNKRVVLNSNVLVTK